MNRWLIVSWLGEREKEDNFEPLWCQEKKVFSVLCCMPRVPEKEVVVMNVDKLLINLPHFLHPIYCIISPSLLSSTFSLSLCMCICCAVVSCLEKELIKVQASSARVTQYPMKTLKNPKILSQKRGTWNNKLQDRR